MEERLLSHLSPRPRPGLSTASGPWALASELHIEWTTGTRSLDVVRLPVHVEELCLEDSLSPGGTTLEHDFKVEHGPCPEFSLV